MCLTPTIPRAHGNHAFQVQIAIYNERSAVRPAKIVKQMAKTIK
jgi:hypothetical protein